jgi:two-component system phosphate regulon sensor histidine kinase PhoR
VRFAPAAAAALTAASIVASIIYLATAIDGSSSVASASAAILLAFAALALTSLLAFRLARQSSQVSDAARAVAAGDVSVRLPEPEGASDLAEAFNRMAASIAALLQDTQAERSRLLAALDSSVDAVAALDADGLVTYANRAAGAVFERSAEELVGSRFAYLLPSDDVVDALRTSRDQGSARTCVVQRSPGEWLQVSAAPIVEGSGWSSLVLIHDVSEVKRVEQMRREFIANVSHELRTPLAGVKSVLETLEGGALADEATAREFIVRADTEVDRLVRLVEELLELSRIESGEVPMVQDTVDMEEVLRNTVGRLRHLAAQANVTLHLEITTADRMVLGDADRLERAVINLINNAIRFTPQGGSVTLTRTVDDGVMAVRVRDTGVGIDPDEMPRVFERFYKADRSRQAGGTGLGLAVVKHTIEAHGGTVGVESAPGAGSTFWFRIPLAPSHD